MKSEPPVIQPAIGGFPDYELLDSGGRRKLERLGPVCLIRGEPKAWWPPARPPAEWERAAASHEEETGWTLQPGCPREWPLQYESLRFLARITETSKHLGVFPEQSPHWRTIREMARPGARLLNLFGYTGAATLVAAAAGWHPTHVDASRPAVSWARENQAASGLTHKPIRWIVEDARQYVRREIRRGSRYEGILLDPPAFGRGPDGQVWKVERQLPELLELCRELLAPAPRLLLVTAYNLEASALMLYNLVAELMEPFGGRVTAGELALAHSSRPGRLLPLSIFARWTP